MSACDVCKQSRYKPGSSIPRRQVTEWPLIPRLTRMLADLVLGADMPAGSCTPTGVAVNQQLRWIKLSKRRAT